MAIVMRRPVPDLSLIHIYTTSKWFGVTYPEDRQSVVDKIQALVDAGEYPAKLF